MKQNLIRFLIAFLLYGILYGTIIYFVDKSLTKQQFWFQIMFFAFCMAIFDSLILPIIIKKRKK